MESFKATERARAQRIRKKKNASAQRIRDKKKAKLASLSEAELESFKVTVRARNQRNGEKKKASLSEAEFESFKAENRANIKRTRKKAHQQDQDDSRDGYGFEIIDTKGPIQQARKYDQEFMQVVGNPNAYRATVCVLCDRLVIGCETVHKITREELLSQSARISVESYEAHHQVTLKP